ncbi:hypothetical protein RvY_10975 [Ramazzottius varieornatus]|uniref:Uncharacterized protein n=1 Tax=Ramazzottius varieornatus TaxID=947166 RepID=A0A1D1VMD7_RAMVA|nr:hypothetical protein RvY_10975 [Ramazzottius varieornatus]
MLEVRFMYFASAELAGKVLLGSTVFDHMLSACRHTQYSGGNCGEIGKQMSETQRDP